MALLTWPPQLVTARSVSWRLETPSQPLPASLAGVPQALFTSGGPFWRLTLSGLYMRDRAGIAAGAALKLNLGSGERPILIAPCDCRQVPLGPGQTLPALGEAGAAPFDGFDMGGPIVATIAAAALRATTVTLTLVAGARPLGPGDSFSIVHPTWGKRRYAIGKQVGGTDEAPQVKIRPPLREGVEAGFAVDFNRSGCVMRLDGEFTIDQTVPGRMHTGEVSFCELERPPSDDGL